jgi:UDP-N-acetylglucosamine:LPS N-acetylglucosamine transferase
MGLGHATRSLPIIKEFVNRKSEVLVGSNGRSLEFLKKELPSIQFIETPNYNISYSQNRLLALKLALQIPKVIKSIKEEKKCCNQIVQDFSPDLIISDHCYGMYHSQIPSYFLCHQIYFAMPDSLKFVSPIVSRFNLSSHKQYAKIIIPDLSENGHGLLSGKLSKLPEMKNKYFFAGILSSINERTVDNKIDLLFSISGPEPQRTVFENIILNQIENVPGKKVVVLGKSEENNVIIEKDDLRIYSHLQRVEMEKIFNQADFIIARPGYSTIMELVELGKNALLVPTPGQTEQEYLAKHMKEEGWFYFAEQKKIDLLRDIDFAKSYSGLKKAKATQKTVENIFNNILYV